MSLPPDALSSEGLSGGRPRKQKSKKAGCDVLKFIRVLQRLMESRFLQVDRESIQP
jgi:hypothetical protein